MKWLVMVMVLASCARPPLPPYFDNKGRDDVASGGVKLIPITTPKGTFNVWTKRVGNNPRVKVLLLTGGPGSSHEYFEALDSYFPAGGVEYYYYDQLGTGFSDNPDDPSLWDLARYVEEVEQVRIALKLDKENFFLVGVSWGGLLATEYALKYQKHLKGLVISSMMSSVKAYNEYSQVLQAKMDPANLAQIKKLEAEDKTETPEYEALLMPFYTEHILRLPVAQWPWPVLRSFSTLNRKMYVMMQGPSELGVKGTLDHWERFDQLKKITVPALVTAGEYDTMDPVFSEKMAKELDRARFVKTHGGHMALYDDQQFYVSALLSFFKDVDDNPH